MTLWRISGHRRLDGAGGLLAAGRWHTQGSRIVYCSPNPATALVEVLVHLEVEVSDLPDRLQYLEIEAPVERARQPSSPAQRAYPGRPRSQPCRRPTAPVIVRRLLGRRICRSVNMGLRSTNSEENHVGRASTPAAGLQTCLFPNRLRWVFDCARRLGLTRTHRHEAQSGMGGQASRPVHAASHFKSRNRAALSGSFKAS